MTTTTECALERQSAETLERMRNNLALACLEALGHHEAGTLDVSADGHKAPPRQSLGVVWPMLQSVEAAIERLRERS